MNSTRMKKIYYNAEIINQTTQSINASYQAGLLTAIVQNPLQYNINVNRFRLPLNGVPLSRQNIPFEKWAVALGYFDNNNNSIATQIVQQINPSTQNINLDSFLFLNEFENGRNIASENNFINNFSGNFVSANGLKDYDTVDNGTIYVLDQVANKITMFDMLSQNIIQTINLTQTDVKCFTVNHKTGDFYIGHDAGITKFVRSGNSWTQSSIVFQTTSILSPTTDFLALFGNYLIGNVYFSFLGENTYGHVLWETDSGALYSLQPTSTTQYTHKVISDQENNIFISSSDNYQNINLYAIISGSLSLINTFTIDTVSYNMIGFDSKTNLAIAESDKIYVFPLTNDIWNVNNSLYSFSDPLFESQQTSLYMFPSQLAIPKVIDNPNFSITSYQQYLDQINNAFTTAMTILKTINPSIPSTVPAPQIIYNPINKLFSIICDGVFLDNTKYKIYLNTNLWNMFLFPSYIDANAPTDNYGSMIPISVKNNVFNATYSSSSTTPEYISVYQESSTKFKFYDLVRILVVTRKIPVNGDIEGINSELNLITDVVPDVDSLTPDDILIYQPSILRNYNLDSNTPLKDIDLQFYYGSRDGSTHPVKLLPNEYASIKLEFEQIIAD